MAVRPTERRRPSSLLDSAIVSGKGRLDEASHDFSSSTEFLTCMQSYRTELEAAFQRHQDKLQHVARLWAARQSGAWRSADGRLNSFVVNGGRLPGAFPETPKLEPPARGLTPVKAATPLRKLAHESDEWTLTEVDGIDEALSNTSSSTRYKSNSPEDSMNSGERSAQETDDAHAVCNSVVNVAIPSFSSCRKVTAWSPPELQMQNEENGLNSVSTFSIGEESFSKRPQASTRSHPSSGTAMTKGLKHHKTSSSVALFSPLSKRTLGQVQDRQTYAERITRSRTYEAVNAVCIILNAMLILWETERRANLAASGMSAIAIQYDELWYTVVAYVFVVIFLADITLRILADGRASLLSFWTLFDIFVTLTAAAEAVVQNLESSFTLRMHLRKFSMLRIVRLLRVIRTTRAVRMVRFFRELRLMVMSLGYAFKPLMWSVVLLLIILLIFGVFFTDGTVAYCINNSAMNQEETQLLRSYFGTLSTSTLSLYMAMTGGVEWGEVFDALRVLPAEYRQLFVVFMTFAILALLNVVTAVFVGTAMQRSQQDAELLIQQEMENKEEFVNTLNHVFTELDSNNSGGLSVEEFEQYLEDDKIMAFLRTLGLNVGQARTLFALLDVDNTGLVDIDEFASGLLRLRGGATNLDMAILKYELQWIHRNIMQLHTLLPDSSNVARGNLDG